MHEYFFFDSLASADSDQLRLATVGAFRVVSPEDFEDDRHGRDVSHGAWRTLGEQGRIWDLNKTSRRPVHVIRDHADEVWQVAFHPTKPLLVSISWDRTARMWNVEDGKEVAILKSRLSPASTVPYSPDGIAKTYRIQLSAMLEVADHRKLRTLTQWERHRFLNHPLNT